MCHRPCSQLILNVCVAPFCKIHVTFSHRDPSDRTLIKNRQSDDSLCIQYFLHSFPCLAEQTLLDLIQCMKI